MPSISASCIFLKSCIHKVCSTAPVSLVLLNRAKKTNDGATECKHSLNFFPRHSYHCPIVSIVSCQLVLGNECLVLIRLGLRPGLEYSNISQIPAGGTT